MGMMWSIPFYHWVRKYRTEIVINFVKPNNNKITKVNIEGGFA